MNPRHAAGYQPDFDFDAAAGHQAELFVADVAKALQEGAVEVKLDERYRDTGRMYIEYTCLRTGGWAASGIATTPCELWAHVLGSAHENDGMLVLPVAKLRLVCATLSRNRAHQGACSRGSHPTRGVVVAPWKLLDMIRYAGSAA